MIQEMKKKYIILSIFSLVEIIMFIITLFLPYFWQIVMIAIMIVIPFAPICFVIGEVLPFPWGSAGNEPYPERETLATREEFLKAQPYICDTCEAFTTSLRETCENCGAEKSLRSSTKKDYKKYVLKK
jgi:hypothetical protein